MNSSASDKSEAFKESSETRAASLTHDTEPGAGGGETVLVFCYALERAGVSHTEVRYREGPVFNLYPLLDGHKRSSVYTPF